MTDVIVVGGGPAGMTAAVAAADAGASVVLYEPNRELGRKLRITGKGRCNVTNDCSPAEVLDNVTRNAKFLRGAMFRTPPAEVMRFFEAAGVPLKTERGRRVFPVSDRAADIAGALADALHKRRVTVIRERVSGLLTDAGRCVGVRAAGAEVRARAVVVATGGLSYPLTGSTGDGYRFARDCGLKVVPPTPSLVPIVTREDFSALSGLSLRNVTLTVTRREGGREIFSEMGEMLFTHFGVSGPLVLSASAHMRGDLAAYAMTIDLKPALDEPTLDARLVSDLRKYERRDFVNALGDLLPQKLIDPVTALTGIPPHEKAGTLTREQRRRLLGILKAFPVTPVRFRPIDEAIVTSGGVDVAGVHTKTMMANAVPGLFFAGEILDVDAYTGGYNLQIAFATGAAAGRGAAEYVKGAETMETTETKKTADAGTAGRKIRIAVDGPSGAGKSTLARALAAKLGLVYVDTGAMYRAVALFMTESGTDCRDSAAVIAKLPEVKLSLAAKEDGGQAVLIDGKDVGGRIRTPEISLAASAVSAIPAVRDFLLKTQKDLAAAGGVVMDGRDIGTVIIPDAEVKIFLTASPEVRARRRVLELEQKGVACSYEQILAETIARDEADRTRAVAPLIPADDAVTVDNGRESLEYALADALALVREKTGVTP